MAKTPTDQLSAFDRDNKLWNVMIETPKGCRNKYKYDEKTRVFALSGVLPAGAVFPFDFGYVPSTLGDDGDPLDVLLLMDEPAFVGCLVPCRLIGVIEAKQTERDGKTTRNDRLVAVPAHSQDMKDVRTIRDLNDQLLDEIQHFFVSYNQIRGKKFKPLGVHGPIRAEKLARQGMRAHEKSR